MKAGISTASLFLRQDVEDAITTVKQLGAECTEIFLSTFYEYRPEFAKKYAPRAEGVEVNSVHSSSMNFENQLFNKYRRARGDGFYWLDQLMSSARIFGSKYYTFHGFAKFKNSAADFDVLANYLREAVLFCARYGVQLSLENVSWCMYNRPGIFREFKNRIPELAGVFDIKQARRSGYPYAMYIKDMEGAISHVHLSDMDENGKMCLPGKGVYDFTEILKRLKDAGFDGNILIEAYSGDYGDVCELKASLEFLNEIIYKV